MSSRRVFIAALAAAIVGIVYGITCRKYYTEGGCAKSKVRSNLYVCYHTFEAVTENVDATNITLTRAKETDLFAKADGPLIHVPPAWLYTMDCCEKDECKDNCTCCFTGPQRFYRKAPLYQFGPPVPMPPLVRSFNSIRPPASTDSTGDSLE